jgi:P-type E1-E2 ATPase
MRLIEAHNLRVEEAILTGESTVVDKHVNPLSGELPLGDRTNMVFSGTTVSAGGGVGVVTATGQDTELGHINQMMAGIEKHRTPLLVQMDKLKALAIILAMMAALFVFSLAFREIPMGELLLSLISLAVASVPEGLPAIISIILSLGVQAMARKRAIIRKLPTVETLGAMTVVCSDKTGTLTMNEMTVKAIITPTPATAWTATATSRWATSTWKAATSRSTSSRAPCWSSTCAPSTCVTTAS